MYSVYIYIIYKYIKRKPPKTNNTYIYIYQKAKIQTKETKKNNRKYLLLPPLYELLLTSGLDPRWSYLADFCFETGYGGNLFVLQLDAHLRDSDGNVTIFAACMGVSGSD